MYGNLYIIYANLFLYIIKILFVIFDKNLVFMIVVCMTSWTKRIKNVKSVVENVMEGTLQPDKLYLSLSIEEFPNREIDLPKDLVNYFNSDGRLIINWVEGENTKCMKKVFPVLQYLEDDDIINALIALVMVLYSLFHHNL